MVLAREAVSKPSAEKLSELRMQRKANSQSDPRKGTPKATAANPRNTTTSTASMTSRDRMNDARYCHLGMGDATMRLRSFF